MIESLPPAGIQPQWISEPIKSQREGGFSSPVIVDGKVYLFAHVREQLEKLGPAQYPYLSPDKRTGMSDEEFAKYEQNRRDESERRAKAYAFKEIVYCLDAESGETRLEEYP